MCNVDISRTIPTTLFLKTKYIKYHKISFKFRAITNLSCVPLNPWLIPHINIQKSNIYRNGFIVKKFIYWSEHTHNLPGWHLYEEMAKGYHCPWTTWKCLNRLRTGFTCSKAQRKKCKFYRGDTTSVCGSAKETTAHMLQCSQLAHHCSLDDLITFNDVGTQWTYGRRRFDDTTMMMS